MCEGARIGLAVAGVLCPASFVSFSMETRMAGTREETRATSTTVIGAPWHGYESWSVRVEKGNGDVSEEGESGPRLTPAWAFPPAALLCFTLAALLRRPRGSAPPADPV